MAQISRNSSPVHHSSHSHSSSRKVKIDDFDLDINAHNRSSFQKDEQLIMNNQHQIHKFISIPHHFFFKEIFAMTYIILKYYIFMMKYFCLDAKVAAAE